MLPPDFFRFIFTNAIPSEIRISEMSVFDSENIFTEHKPRQNCSEHGYKQIENGNSACIMKFEKCCPQRKCRR